MITSHVLAALVLALIASNAPAAADSTPADAQPGGAGVVDLSGDWRLRLDPQDQGLAASWPGVPLATDDRITLPNTTDRAGFGFALDTRTMLHAAPFPPTTRFPGVKEPTRADEHGYLVRRYLFVGPAWYEREVEIPAMWKDRSVTLRIERAMWKTDVWVDGRPAGSGDSLVAEHRHELGELAPGHHRLTIRVDNRMIYNISTVTHAYGPETQSRWNGMLGTIALEAALPIAIRSVAVFPVADRRSVRVVMHMTNSTNQPAIEKLRLRLTPEQGDELLADSSAEIACSPGESTNEVTLELAQPAQSWDEFRPVRYRLRVARRERRCIRCDLRYVRIPPCRARREGTAIERPPDLSPRHT